MIAAFLLVGSLAASSGVLRVSAEAPAEVDLGAEFAIRVELSNLGREALVVREPAFDARSFWFEVTPEGGRTSRFVRFHPAAGEGSTLRGVELPAGGKIAYEIPVDAIWVGEMTFVPHFGGAGDDVSGEPIRVRTRAEEDERLVVVFETDAGVFRAALWPKRAPATCLHFARLVREGFYDGTIFHRVVRGFCIQGGCPRGDGTGSPGYTVAAEFHDAAHDRGVLSMARRGDPLEARGEMPRPRYRDSAGSQFFVCLGRHAFLDGRYTAFGRVIDGWDVLDAIERVEVAEQPNGELSRPLEPVRLRRARLEAVESRASAPEAEGG